MGEQVTSKAAITIELARGFNLEISLFITDCVSSTYARWEEGFHVRCGDVYACNVLRNEFCCPYGVYTGILYIHLNTNALTDKFSRQLDVISEWDSGSELLRWNY